ncbi:MAG: ribbon-helix-helix domain-containing protein [Chloroflexota bacterium]|nr:ribbon-helix-helix domain-containing protein [Chloroflexota bacterium]
MRTTLILPDQMAARLELQSQRSGLTVSELIRSAIDAQLNYQDTLYLEGRVELRAAHVLPEEDLQPLLPVQATAEPPRTIVFEKPVQAEPLPPTQTPEGEAAAKAAARQARIDRMAMGGSQHEETGRSSPFVRKRVGF